MPVARVQLPDGRIARLEVPDGTTPQQVEAFVLENMGNGVPKRNAVEQVKRGLGLTMRAAGPILAGGAAGAALGSVVPGVGTAIGGAAGITAAALTTALDKLVGTNVTDSVMDSLGVPRPETRGERLASDVAGAMTGQAGVMKGAELMKQAAGPVVRRVGEVLAAGPTAQMVGAAGAGGAAGAAREEGAGPVGQAAAGLAGGLVAPLAAQTVASGAKALGRGVAAAAKPFTKGGREEVVGTTLRRLSSEPESVMAKLGEAVEIVPGSAPTTAQAARDPGLLTAERALRSGPSGARFTERASQQNQARNILLNSMAGDDAALASAKGARSDAAAPAYAAALDSATPIKPPETLVALAQRPAFADAMKRAQAIAAEEGVDLGDPLKTMRGLHYVKMGLDDVLDGSFTSGIGKTQSRAIGQTREQLLKIMDDLSPEYRTAREGFSAQSKPINQMEALQDVRTRALNAGTDAATGERIMSPAKFYQAVTKNEADLRKVLTPDQMKNLRAIGQDLDRGALSDTAGKAAGSNTYQNVSTAYILGKSLGGQAPDSPMLQNLMRPLAWLNKLNEPALQELVTDAMLDPAIARSLMGRASPRAVESMALELQERARALTLGTVGAQATQGKRSEKPEAAIRR